MCCASGRLDGLVEVPRSAAAAAVAAPNTYIYIYIYTCIYTYYI